MALKQNDTTRRRLLKGIGATGLALSTAGVAAAKDGGTADGDASTEGSWEYRCTDYGCSGGHGCQEQRRYCSNGSCSGWEASGCCGCLS